MFGKPKSTVDPITAKGGVLEDVKGQTCVITQGTVIEGKFHCTENVRLDGTIKGEVRCDKRLVMGDSGKVEGNVISLDASIRGRVEGNIEILETLQLHSSAFIKGNIRAKSLSVEEGAIYNGECRIGGERGGKEKA
jgi:cytoskeletal protein CcmA (bactofilin family)